MFSHAKCTKCTPLAEANLMLSLCRHGRLTAYWQLFRNNQECEENKTTEVKRKMCENYMKLPTTFEFS